MTELEVKAVLHLAVSCSPTDPGHTFSSKTSFLKIPLFKSTFFPNNITFGAKPVVKTPNVMLFGKNVDLNRGIFKKEVLEEKAVECPKYVQDLVRMQEQS